MTRRRGHFEGANRPATGLGNSRRCTEMAFRRMPFQPALSFHGEDRGWARASGGNVKDVVETVGGRPCDGPTRSVAAERSPFHDVETEGREAGHRRRSSTAPRRCACSRICRASRTSDVEFVKAIEDQSLELKHVGNGHRFVALEVREIAQKPAHGVAQLASRNLLPSNGLMSRRRAGRRIVGL